MAVNEKKIIVLKQFYEQAKDIAASQKAFDAICKRIKELKKRVESGECSLYDLLLTKNGKHLKQGKRNCQFKFRMTYSERIFYTYGRYIDGTPDEYASALFIYGYSRHDEQDDQSRPEFSIEDVIQEEPEEVTDKDVVDYQLINFNNTGFDYVGQHTFYVFDEDHLPESLNDADVYLSKEQSEKIESYFRNPRPTLILGGAGTGKTVMEIHLLHDYKSNHSNSRCGYFTQSNALLDKADKRYKYVISQAGEADSEGVKFHNINDFCMEFIERKSGEHIDLSSVVYERDFYTYMDELCPYKTKLEEAGLSPYDVLAEIRGTIKGGLDSHWRRCDILRAKEYSSPFMKKLKDLGLFHALSGDNSQFEICDLKKYNESKLEFDTQSLRDTYNDVYNKINMVDPHMGLRNKFDYARVSAENSTLPLESRDLIYKVAEGYQSWLIREKKYDDNDLVMKVLECGIEDDDKFDFVVVDEIQDYTELQVFLLCCLAKDKSNIIMAGDEHQIINPTIFGEGRLKMLFYDPKKSMSELRVEKLVQNFRCPREVVDVANRLIDVGKSKIASRGEQDEIAVSNCGHRPFYVNADRDKLNSFLRNMLRFPNVSVLVANDFARESLIKDFGKEEYDKANNPIIRTVAEIKGMEYKFVVCHNLVNSFVDPWNEIMDGLASRGTRYRYYLNLFYVGITRSQQYLGIFESAPHEILDNVIDTNVDQAQVLENALSLLENMSADESDWLEAARRECESGNYAKAMILLRNVKTAGAADVLLKCQMGSAFEQKDFLTAAKYALATNSKSMLSRLSRESVLSEDIRMASQMMADFEGYMTTVGKQMPNIREMFDRIFSEEDSALKEKASSNIIKMMNDYIFELNEKMNKKLKEIA